MRDQSLHEQARDALKKKTSLLSYGLMTPQHNVRAVSTMARERPRKVPKLVEVPYYRYMDYSSTHEVKHNCRADAGTCTIVSKPAGTLRSISTIGLDVTLATPTTVVSNTYALQSRVEKEEKRFQISLTCCRHASGRLLASH